MSKVTIDMSEFVHLKDESVYNHNYYKHKEFRYVILRKCDEEANTLHFYLVEAGKENTFLFSCRDDSEGTTYKGDLGFYWS